MTLHPLNTEKLPFGDENLNTDENCLLFEAVHLYVKQSGRFVVKYIQLKIHTDFLL